MSNLKRGIFSPTKRRSMQHEPAKASKHHSKAAANKRHHSNIRSHREKRAIICQVLQQGSGLVLQSNSVKRNFTFTASPNQKKRLKIDLPENNLPSPTTAVKKKPIIVGNVDVCSELSQKEESLVNNESRSSSKIGTKKSLSVMPNWASQAAHDSTKAKSIFGMRRSTFNEKASVLSGASSGGGGKAPVLGAERFRKNFRASSEYSEGDTAFPRQNTERLPDINMPSIPEHNKNATIYLAGQSRVKREPLPLEAIEQFMNASFKMKERTTVMSDPTRRDIIKANKRKVMDNAAATRKKGSLSKNLPETESMKNNRASGEPGTYTPEYYMPPDAEEDALDGSNQVIINFPRQNSTKKVTAKTTGHVFAQRPAGYTIFNSDGTIEQTPINNDIMLN